MIGEGSLIDITSTFILEYKLSVLQFLIRNSYEHHTLIEIVSLLTVLKTVVWILLVRLGWSLYHKWKLDYRVFYPAD